VVAYRRMWFRSHVDHEGQRAPTKMDWADSHRCPTGSLNERDACVLCQKQARFDLRWAFERRTAPMADFL
jgi:hypothetical protein